MQTGAQSRIPELGVDVEPFDALAPVRLLIVVDGFGATHQISFIKPLEAWRAHGVARLRLIDERSLSRLRAAGDKALRQSLSEEFRRLKPTAVILSRYSGPEYPLLFELARERQIPVVCHLDDDMFEVPISLGIDLYRRYRHPRRVHALYRIAEAADLVYVSTPALGRRVQERLKPRRLAVAGIYVGADGGERLAPAAETKEHVDVGYMASAGHAFDLELVAGAVQEVLRRFPRVRFHLFGSICRAETAKAMGPEVIRHDRTTGSYTNFRLALGDLGWDIGLAPLRDHEFNHCKAPTKWLEYADAGIVTLASDNPVYRPLAQQGALALSSDDCWADALAMLIDDPQRRRRLMTRAFEVIEQDHLWSRVESQVIDVLAQLPLASVAEVSDTVVVQ